MTGLAGDLDVNVTEDVAKVTVAKVWWPLAALYILHTHNSAPTTFANVCCTSYTRIIEMSYFNKQIKKLFRSSNN